MPSAARTPNSLAEKIRALAPEPGVHATRHPAITLYRVTEREVPTPTLYRACLILVGSGEQQATLGDETFAYNAAHYLVVTSPLPMICRTLAWGDTPLLSMVVEIELALVRELVLEEEPAALRSTPSRSVFRGRLTPEIEDAAGRLLDCLADARRARVLCRQTVRELLFWVLEGPDGDSLRALADGPTGQLAHVLRHMSAHHAERLPVTELAAMAHMSLPTFHQHFKATTGTSPLRYVKAVRLTRARDLLRGGALVKEVAREVGYESESQFSREYRRFFGAPPSGAAPPRARGRRPAGVTTLSRSS